MIALIALIALVRHAHLPVRGLRSVVVPVPLRGPSGTPLAAPLRRRLMLPLLPVSRRHVIVTHWHGQNGSRNELRRDEYPRALVTAAHMPARRSEYPILPAVEEDIPRCLRRVTHCRNARDHDQRRRRRQ